MEGGAWQQQQPGGAANVPRLRPLDIGQKLDAAIKLTTRNFGTLATIVLILAIPIQILTVLVTLSTLPEDYTVGGGFGSGVSPDDPDVGAGYWVGVIFIGLLGFLVNLLITAGCFKAISHAYLGGSTSWRDSLDFAVKRLPSVLWVSILVGLAVAGGAILLLVGAVWLGVAFALAVPVLLLEGKKGTGALGRSWELVKGRWWRTFGLLAAGYVLIIVISGILEGIILGLTVVAVGDDSALAVVLSSIARLVSEVLTTPFIAALTIVLYFDLRVRKEAFDLQVIARAMGGTPPGDALAAGQSMPWFAPPAWGGGPPGQAPGWGGGPPGQPPGWGQPQQGPPGQAQGWGQPPQGPPGQAQGWGQPPQGPPPQRGGQPPGWGQPPQPLPPQQWEPPAPPREPPAPPQQWEPPAPPDPPGRSSS